MNLKRIRKVFFMQLTLWLMLRLKKIKNSTCPKDWAFLFLYQKLKAAKVNWNEKYNDSSENFGFLFTHHMSKKKRKPTSLPKFRWSPTAYACKYCEYSPFWRIWSRHKILFFIVSLSTCKIYTYLVENRSLLKKKMELFYDNLKPERNNEETLTIQTDREFNQNEIKKSKWKIWCQYI